MDADALRAKLGGEILKASWADLAPHHARGALLLPDGAVDLLDVAMAVALDDKARVADWVAGGRLGRVPEEQAEAWAEQAPWFQAVIVQPWVLAQPLPDPAG